MPFKILQNFPRFRIKSLQFNNLKMQKKTVLYTCLYCEAWICVQHRFSLSDTLKLSLYSQFNKIVSIVVKPTLMCLSIGTPKNNKFSICPKWKIHYFQVFQNLGRVQPHNLFEYWDTQKSLIFHLRQREN